MGFCESWWPLGLQSELPLSHLEGKKQWFFDVFTFCVLIMARSILDPFWCRLGALDGPFWLPLAHLWPVLVVLWRPLAHLWRPLAAGWASLGSPGCPKSLPWAHMNHLEIPLWRCLAPMAAHRCPNSPPWTSLDDPEVPYCLPPGTQTLKFGCRNAFMSNYFDKKYS